GPAAVGWEGGAAVVPTDVPDPTLPAFVQALRGGSAEPLDEATVAGLADLVPVGRVLEALRASARTEAWCELS
ncbi:MAG: hypothetical protein JWO60_292, partial [Frankiales bacterium]|nr:hypothetical protein [Frankiales bacterium]